MSKIKFLTSILLLLVCSYFVHGQMSINTIKGLRIAKKMDKSIELIVSKSYLIKKLNSDKGYLSMDKEDGYSPFNKIEILEYKGDFFLKLESSSGISIVSLEVKNKDVFIGNIACYSKQSQCSNVCKPIGSECLYCDSCVKFCFTPRKKK